MWYCDDIVWIGGVIYLPYNVIYHIIKMKHPKIKMLFCDNRIKNDNPHKILKLI